MIQQIGNRVFIDIAIESIDPVRTATTFYIDNNTFVWGQETINETTEEWRKDFEKSMRELLHKQWTKDG